VVDARVLDNFECSDCGHTFSLHLSDQPSDGGHHHG
jgi:hypothetical protein